MSHARRPVGRHRSTSSARSGRASPQTLLARVGALGATGVVAVLLVSAAPEASSSDAAPPGEGVEAALAVRLGGASRGSRGIDRLVVTDASTDGAEISAGSDEPAAAEGTTSASVDAGVVALTDVLEPLGVPVPIGAGTPALTEPTAPAPAAPPPPAAQTPAAGELDVTSFVGGGAALGLRAGAARVYSAVRAAFDIGSFSGYRAGDQDHGSGKAVDVMISSSAQGDAVAAFVLAHAKELNVKYVIWSQRIYNMDRPGWRRMANRGSATANHYDHVHISVN